MDKPFVSYEYTQIAANRKELHFLLDCYESLGWEQDTRLEQEGKHLTLRRSRKLVNHMELTRLQAHLESCLSQIETLEKNRSSRATSAALAVGIAGTVLMVFSVFAVTAQPPHILLCILFGGPAMALWALAPIIYRRLYAKQSAVVSELVLKKRDEIFEICEKGSKLL